MADDPAVFTLQDVSDELIDDVLDNHMFTPEKLATIAQGVNGYQVNVDAFKSFMRQCMQAARQLDANEIQQMAKIMQNNAETTKEETHAIALQIGEKIVGKIDDIPVNTLITKKPKAADDE